MSNYKFKNELFNSSRENVDKIKDHLRNSSQKGTGIYGEEKKGDLVKDVYGEDVVKQIVAADKARGEITRDYELAHAELSAEDFLGNKSLTETSSSIAIGRSVISAKTVAHKEQLVKFNKDEEGKVIHKYLDTRVKTKIPNAMGLAKMRKAYQEEFKDSYEDIAKSRTA